MKKAAFIYSDKFQKYDYGKGHPLKMIRLMLTYELLKRCGMLSRDNVEVVEAEPCTRKEAETVHHHVYLDVLRCVDENCMHKDLSPYGLGYGDNPAFAGVFAGSMLSTGASLQAARIVHEEKAASAFNISGGLHHAMPGRASGFCYINDPAVAIKFLAANGRKVLYVDIDAHHGDGVQHVFYETDQVMTVSLHESGHYLFPGTGFPENIGAGKGRGYSVNLPLLPGTGDEIFKFGFFELLPPLVDKFRPDIIVTQLGCDSFESDPLTHLRLSTHGFTDMVRWFGGLGLPWVALGGGGYDVVNVARAWSLAFGIMADAELPEEMPEDFKELLEENGLEAKKLKDESPTSETGDEIKRERDYACDMLGRLRKELFPVLGIRS
ncbi:MAG TPA: acetoin utilization protein AcuC [Nitrospirota bacterium]|nr:acetoin utilization protein AcuC [Nitrospirota bacterium]